MIALEDVIRRLIDDDRFIDEVPNKTHRELLGYMFGINNSGHHMTRVNACRRIGKYGQYGVNAIDSLCKKFTSKIGEEVYYEDENTTNILNKPRENEDHKMAGLSRFLVSMCYRDQEEIKARLRPYVEELIDHRLEIELQTLAIDAVERIQTMDDKRDITLTINFKRPEPKA